MPFTEQDYTDEQKHTLLQIAASSIQHGLQNGKPLSVSSIQYEKALQELRATFITLERLRQLRGCIGMLNATRPLVADVANNAYAAAFNDPRFAPLQNNEFEGLDIHISILTPPEDFPIDAESDLLNQLVPNEDGLILQEGMHRSTFLPSVWESLPDPRDFLNHLKQKAGLSANYWSDNIKFQRYRTISFGKTVAEL